MKWFKHDSNANNDAKMKKVRIKYGMEGYGLYWYLLELIAQGVDKNALTFELEHDAEIIAHDTGIHHERVQEMMTYMVDLELFENAGGLITCMKMATRTDDYIGRLCSGEHRIHTEVNTKKVPLDKKRKEKKNTVCIDGFDQFWDDYPNKVNKQRAVKAWTKLNKQDRDAAHGLLAKFIDSLPDFQKNPVKLHASTYLNDRRWEDEASNPAGDSNPYAGWAQ
jgi:hypothetical protein